MSDEIPYGYCQCGCGQKTKVAERNHTPDMVKGQPMKFISGHNKRIPLLKRFWNKVNKRSDDECWEWTGHKDEDGYGGIEMDYKNPRAHRVSYELHNGTIPEGQIIRHTCDNPSCVNPKHLICGTFQDNTDDMIERNRCNPRKGEAHPSAKLTEDDVRTIRKLKGKKSESQIAREYGVTAGTISDIFKGETWKHVK